MYEPVADPGEGPRGAWAPVPLLPRSYFWTKLKKVFGRPSPLPLPSPLPSPLISRSGSGTVNIATVSRDRMALRFSVQYPLASPQTSVGVRLSCIEKWMRDNRTPTDVCGEAKYPSAVCLCVLFSNSLFLALPRVGAQNVFSGRNIHEYCQCISLKHAWTFDPDESFPEEMW